MQPTKLPAPEATDPKDVALPLEEAIALWATGKREEALVAIGRAADAAERAGAFERAGALRAAVAAQRDAASGAPAAATGRPPPPSVKGSVVPQPPSMRAPQAALSHAPPPPSARAVVKVPSAPPTSAAPPAQSSPPQAAAQAAPATAMDASAASSPAGAGLHVWVRASARDPSLLLVRLLPDGHPAPPGSYEAFLRAADAGADLLAPKH